MRKKIKVNIFLATFLWVGCFQGEELIVMEVPTAWAQEKNNKPATKPQGKSKEQAKPQKNSKVSKAKKLEVLRMMEKIEEKTKELKKREEEINVREGQLKALEVKLGKDIQRIEAALKKSKELMNASTNLRDENLDSLVKIYSAMKPEDAAPLISVLNEKIAIQIISKMKSKLAGQVMSKLDTEAAKKISEKIVGADLFAKSKE